MNQRPRLPHIADMRLFLDQRFFPPAGAAVTAGLESTSGRQRLWTILLAVLLIAALVPAALYFRTPSQPVPPQMRFEIALPAAQAANFVVSPDGQRLAYVAQPREDTRAS
jgi:hypothetical protein